MTALAAPSGPAAPASARDVHPLGKVIWDQVYGLYDQHEFERSDRVALRKASGGLDPDIAALKSTATWWRVAKQVERNQADYALYARARRFLYPD